MYKQVKTQKHAHSPTGQEIEPKATLKDEYGGVAHIGTDDHCYVLYLKGPNGCKKTPYIFREAFNVLKTLPEPN